MIECHSLKKNTGINKIVPDFMDTLYIMQLNKTTMKASAIAENRF